MRAWKFNNASEHAGLVMNEMETPRPGPGELLIQVCAVGVTPTELLWATTTKLKTGEARIGAVPGHEFSGIVAGIGPGGGVKGEEAFEVGQEVFGMNDWWAEGAAAEFCCARATEVLPKPESLSHAEAASAPIGALTAWQGLFDRADLKPGERLLVHGGSGAVGVYALQLARQRGAEVLTTASDRNRDVLLKLGAHRVIDYRAERFEELVGEVDVVFDGVGGETLTRSWGVLGPRGRLVTIAADSEGSQDPRTRAAFFIVAVNRQQLETIASQMASGQLRPVVKRVLPFEQAERAYFPDRLEQHGCGKTVVAVALQT